METDRVAELEQSLSLEERARADRFHFMRDRKRFIAARGSLRIILGEYLNREPHQIRFAYTSDQKPVAADEGTIRFNVSHSDALALIAVTRGREIGIDVERLRTDFNPEAMAKRFFSPREYAALQETPQIERHGAFLSYWTCKEAYLKALGTGLRSSLKEFSVSLEDHSIVLVGSGGDEIAPYYLTQINPAPGYVAALAIECPNAP